MQFWGTYCNRNYGWKRDGKEVGLTDNGYIRRYWQGGLELTAMMLSFYRHTGDQDFLKTTLLPVATEVVTFYDEHYKRDTAGKINFYPAQVLESIWDAENPMPEIAGLRFNLPELLALPDNVTTPAQREQWRRVLSELPPLPQGETKGLRVLKDAAQIHGGRHNAENAQLYAVWPYRLYGAGMPDYELALNTWKTRPMQYKAHSCWHNDILWGAFLGLPSQARNHLGSRFMLSGSFRFPAMYIHGDEVPDHDNGGVCQNTLQTMILQTVGSPSSPGKYDAPGRILLLPAWPKNWNVSFKLHAPQQTTVEGVYRDGKMEKLQVKPESRRKDVVITEGESK